MLNFFFIEFVKKKKKKKKKKQDTMDLVCISVFIKGQWSKLHEYM